MPSLRKDLRKSGLPAVFLCRMEESGADKLGGRHMDSEMSMLTDSFSNVARSIEKTLTPWLLIVVSIVLMGCKEASFSSR